MHQQTRCGHEATGSDDEHSDAIDRRADDFHELSKVFHPPTLLAAGERFNTVPKVCGR
jgi:hypothetical protein